MMPIMGQIDLLLSKITSGKCTLDLVEHRLADVQQTVHNYMKRSVILLDVSRLNCGKFRLHPVPCDLASLLRQIVDEFGAAAQHSAITLAVTAPESVPGFWDRLAVEQVINNLLSKMPSSMAATPQWNSPFWQANRKS
jgi:two-component system, OmpR family, sensor kinase